MSGLPVRDPLYGTTVVPEWLVEVFRSPEVQRLRGVRLMNTATDELPALSDISRYTHTIGALWLAKTFSEANGLASRESGRTASEFLVATVLHDVATPAFGHVFEYLLMLRKGWRHEEFVEDLLRGSYRGENRYHAVYARHSLCLWDVVSRMGLDPEGIRDEVCGRSRLGEAISSALDLDNIDTAFRMAQALGIARDGEDALALARALHYDDLGVFVEPSALGLIDRWRQLRRRCYEAFLFNLGYRVSQLMLSTAIRDGLEVGILSVDDWFLTDAELLARLLKHRFTRNTAQRFLMGDLYTALFLGWYAGGSGGRDFRDPALLSEVESALTAALGPRCTMHVVLDNGAFEKPLDLRLSGGERRTVGHRSDSLLVTIATAKRIGASRRHRLAAIEVLGSFGLEADALLIEPGEVSGGVNEQLRLLPGA